MTVLRLKQIALGSDHFRAELEFSGPGQMPMNASAEFNFALSTQDQRDLRWYMEDYLQNPHEPAPTIAKRIETRMADIGLKLFTDIFRANDDIRDLWATLRAGLDDTRVEVIASVQEATTIPWELLCDPMTQVPLALRAKAFVRTQSTPQQRPALPQAQAGEAIRILLVIARPSAGQDVPFRSVAARILKSLTEADRKVYQLDVLRPATYDALAERLERAKAVGKPYHVVHFDGHGTYGSETGGAAVNAMLYGSAGKRGYLIFEGDTDQQRWVDGKRIGDLLVRTDVPLLLLNACQSAYAEAPEQPSAAAGDIHAEVRAFGSLAQQVMDAGTAGVVAMRYSVYVVTAAQFVADMYRALVSGLSLGEAVTRGRKALYDKPERKIGSKPIPLQDWSVPLVYEAAPILLFPKQAAQPVLTIDLTQASGEQQDTLPRPPDVGFFGRDETLLALDRGFDKHHVALLHALAGSGKTTTAAEFARWYAVTGGLGAQHAMLFTSFERHKPLARALDDFGSAFGQVLAANGIHWSAVDIPVRRAVALQIMQQIPVFWIWDNVEPVAGFPAGSPSQWAAEEQKELIDFLRDAKTSKAKFLLTSRRDEDDWLGLLPFRVEMPAMPLRERVDLAVALAERRGVRDFDAEAWRPLLRYTAGNPLTITVLVDQALKQGLRTNTDVEAFVAKLRAGEADIEDVNEDEGRGASLAASLRYGFEAGFSDEEKAILALLHLFQGFVGIVVLVVMGLPDEEWTLDALCGKEKEALVSLLDRAAEAGLLTVVGKGYYTIHPALPWYFKQLFAVDYGDDAAHERAQRAYVEAVGYWSNYYAEQIVNGNSNVLGLLALEEDNILAARRLALKHGWHRNIIETMQGLRMLYERTGRSTEWARLVIEIVPIFCDPVTDMPGMGVEESAWSLVTGYRVDLAQEARDLDAAERMQQIRTEVNRRRAAPALAGDLSTDSGYNLIRTLSVSIFALGHIQSERGDAACVTAYEEAVTLDQRIGDRASEAVDAFNLGHAYKDIPTIRDLDKADYWYQRSLDLRTLNDTRGRAKSLGQLGFVAYERFKAARDTNAPETDQLNYLNEALRLYREKLDLLSANDLPELSITHGQLGNIYNAVGQTTQARTHYDAAIRNFEQMGDVYNAAQTRYNIAVMYAQQGEFDTALLYAEAAQRNFQASPNAADRVQHTQQLIDLIKQSIQGGGS